MPPFQLCDRAPEVDGGEREKVSLGSRLPSTIHGCHCVRACSRLNITPQCTYMNRGIQIMTWRMETGRGDRKKGRGECSCSSDDIQEEKEWKGSEGKNREGEPRSQCHPLRRHSPHWSNFPSLGFSFEWTTTTS